MWEWTPSFAFWHIARACVRAIMMWRAYRTFNVPIREAIEHHIKTVPSTWDSSGKSHQAAFGALHKEMCTGRLPVVGAKEEGGVTRRIPPKRCRELRTAMTVVPPGPAAPDGVRFDLYEKWDEEAMMSGQLDPSSSPPLRFTGLRVRRVDLHYLWPPDAA